MKLLWLLLPGGSLVLLYLLYRSWKQEPRLSSTWLADQVQRETKVGIDGVSWSWPVKPYQAGDFPELTDRIRRFEQRLGAAVAKERV